MPDTSSKTSQRPSNATARCAHLPLAFVAALGMIAAVESPATAQQSRPAPRPLEAYEVAIQEKTRLPELTRKAQDQIEVTPNLDGVLITSVTLQASEEPGTRTMVLAGRMRVAQQGPLIAKVMMEVLQSESFWSTQDDEFVISTEMIKTQPPSRIEGSRLYGIGIDHFLKGQYREAEKVFTSALVESPERQSIHFWKAAGAIGSSDPEWAERRLEAVLRRNRKGSIEHASEMERFQGPLRNALHQMEDRVRLKISR